MIIRLNKVLALPGSRVTNDETRPGLVIQSPPRWGDAAEARGTEIRLYDERDVPWIATIVDHVIALVGEPWRALREQLDHVPIPAPRVKAILAALRRMLGGRAERIRVARRVRARVLGPAALDDATRDARIDAAAADLGIDAAAVRELMWIDLANERPVALPEGRPSERRLAAYANVDRIQHAVRRARHLTLRVWGDAHELIRMAARYGLIATVTRHDDTTVLDVVGPLSLFHATSVYGRSLAALVPLLAEHARFDLTLDCDFGHGPATLRVVPPALLPPVGRGAKAPSLALRLARGLRKLGIDAELDPPPIIQGRELLYPELAVTRGGRRWHVDLIGFATADYLTAKLARYRAAGIDVVLCVDDKRAPGTAVDPRVLVYPGKLTAELLVDFLSRSCRSRAGSGPRPSLAPSD